LEEALHGTSAVKTAIPLIMLAWCSAGQDTPASSEANRLLPQTRAGQIEMERELKAAKLTPERTAGIELRLQQIEDARIVQRITGGVAGFRLKLGGLINRSGFAAGPEYYRQVLHEKARVSASIRGSLRRYYLMEAGFEAPSLADGHAFASLWAMHFDYPSVDYYGPGPNSHKQGRSDYLLEETGVEARPGVQPVEHLRLGGIGRYLLFNVGPGRDDTFADADRLYSEQTTPGLQYQSNFLVGGGFLQYDWRDNPGRPRSGGNYTGQFATYSDTLRGHYSFDRLDLEAQQYIGFFNKQRVIALRGRIQATDPHQGNQVPFYLQPTLGGGDDLRGYRAFRFYDNNSALLTAEYRWEVFHGLDMALFGDAGQVFDRWQQINFRRLRTDFGFGFRLSANNQNFMRIDTAFSNEGFAVWAKFGGVFENPRWGK
jgi:hypothetical protein